MSILGKNFREELKVKPKLGILDALKSLGLDESLLVNDMVKGNILMDAGRALRIPEDEIRNARLDKGQVEALRSLIGKDGSYRTLDGVDMSGLRYYLAVAKDYKGDVNLSIQRSGRRNEGALRDTDIRQTHTYNKDGIEMEYSSAEYFSDEPEYSRSAIASTRIRRREDMVTQTIQKTGNEKSKLFSVELNDFNYQLRNGTILIAEDRPEHLIINPSDYEGRTDYTNRAPHPFDQKNRLTALYKRTRFDFRNYPQMPEAVKKDMEQIEKDVATGRE